MIPINNRRIVIVFLFSFLAVIVSSIWVIHSIDFRAILALISSLGVFVGSAYFSKKDSTKYDSEGLSKVNYSEVKVISKKLNVNSVSNKKKDLILAIVSSSNNKNNFMISLLLWILLGLAIVAVSLFFWTPLRWQNVNLRISFYDTINDRVELVHFSKYRYDISIDDRNNNQVVFPLRLAINNPQDYPIVIDRVEIYYPRALKIRSRNNAIIDPDNSVIVYENNIKTLRGYKYFTPLETIDSLIIPTEFKPSDQFSINSKGVPEFSRIYMHLMWMKVPDFDYTIKFYLSDGRVVQETFILKLTIPSTLTSDPSSKNKAERILRSDSLLFEKSRISKYDILNSWESEYKSHLVSYKYATDNSSNYQYIIIDKFLRRINVDANRNGFIDYSLLNYDSDNFPDKKILSSSDVISPMVDWSDEVLER